MMTPAWRRSIQRGERKSRPVAIQIHLSLGPIMRTVLFERAEALHLNPNQLVTQIVECWLVDRKKPFSDYTCPECGHAR